MRDDDDEYAFQHEHFWLESKQFNVEKTSMRWLDDSDCSASNIWRALLIADVPFECESYDATLSWLQWVTAICKSFSWRGEQLMLINLRQGFRATYVWYIVPDTSRS